MAGFLSLMEFVKVTFTVDSKIKLRHSFHEYLSIKLQPKIGFVNI